MADVHLYEIYLNVYDFVGRGNRLLQALGLPLYHTGVEINSVEFCYAIVSPEEDDTGVIMIEPETAEYSFQSKRYIGQVLLPARTFENIVERLTKKYTCGNYHAFTNNCNHFSDEFVRSLLGKGLSSEILRATSFMEKVCCCLPEGFLNGSWARDVFAHQSKPAVSHRIVTERSFA